MRHAGENHRASSRPAMTSMESPAPVRRGAGNRACCGRPERVGGDRAHLVGMETAQPLAEALEHRQGARQRPRPGSCPGPGRRPGARSPFEAVDLVDLGGAILLDDAPIESRKLLEPRSTAARRWSMRQLYWAVSLLDYRRCHVTVMPMRRFSPCRTRHWGLARPFHASPLWRTLCGMPACARPGVIEPSRYCSKNKAVSFAWALYDLSTAVRAAAPES